MPAPSSGRTFPTGHVLGERPAQAVVEIRESHKHCKPLQIEQAEMSKFTPQTGINFAVFSERVCLIHILIDRDN